MNSETLQYFGSIALFIYFVYEYMYDHHWKIRYIVFKMNISFNALFGGESYENSKAYKI